MTAKTYAVLGVESGCGGGGGVFGGQGEEGPLSWRPRILNRSKPFQQAGRADNTVHACTGLSIQAACQ